jgi:predicted amidohydrolase YtcJ
VAIHAVEGEALVAAVAALAALEPERVRARRHRIEHASLVPPPLVEEIARLGATVVTHPLFAEAFAAKYRDEISPEEQPWLYPMAAWQEARVPLALGSDAPIATAEPLRNVAAAIERGLAPLDAFAAHSFGGARAAFDERRFGRLEIGAAADLVLLEGDPLCDPASSRVVATLVAGEVIFER